MATCASAQSRKGQLLRTASSTSLSYLHKNSINQHGVHKGVIMSTTNRLLVILNSLLALILIMVIGAVNTSTAQARQATVVASPSRYVGVLRRRPVSYALVQSASSRRRHFPGLFKGHKASPLQLELKAFQVPRVRLALLPRLHHGQS